MASSKSESKKAKLSAVLEGAGVIELPMLDTIRAALGDVSDGYLRKLLKESGVPLAPLVEGVNQDNFESLERTLLALSSEYENPEKRRGARRIVISAKDHAKFAVRRASDPARRAEKEEMVIWMLTWLDNPALFPLWVPLRKKEKGIREHGSLSPE